MACILILSLAACSSKPNELNPSFAANAGSNRTTSPGDPIQEEWLYGKWDVDGERTNTANGNPGLIAIGSDIARDMFGKGWKFEPNGVIKIDRAGGYVLGTYRIQGNRLLIKKAGDADFTKYNAHFQDGYLYLYGPDSRWSVMEYAKYFGF